MDIEKLLTHEAVSTNGKVLSLRKTEILFFTLLFLYPLLVFHSHMLALKKL